MRILPPIARINLVADRRVPHVLRNFERPHLIFGVRLLINGIRRSEENGPHSQPAGKQALRQWAELRSAEFPHRPPYRHPFRGGHPSTSPEPQFRLAHPTLAIETGLPPPAARARTS